MSSFPEWALFLYWFWEEAGFVKMQSILISELLPLREMREITEKTGAGIELIRFSIASELDRLDDAIAEVRSTCLSGPDQPHLTLHGPYMDLNPSTWDSEVRQATMKRFSQAHAAARALGAKKLVLHTGFIPNANFLEGWPPRMADCYSVRPVPEWAERLLPALGHVHFHDNHGPQPFLRTPDEHLALGAGTLPVKALLEILKGKPDLTCAIECSRKDDVVKSLEVLLA